MTISIETVMPIRTTIAVCLIIPFAVHIFEDMRAVFTFFGSHSICFLVIYITSYFLSVIFNVVSSIAFSASGDIRATTQCQMTPFPAVLTLQNTWVHISISDGSNKLSYIEMLVNNVLS